MTDLKRVSVQVSFRTTSGYSMTQSFVSEGRQAALEAIDELARIVAVDGGGKEAVAAAEAAVQRVADDVATQQSAP